MRTRSLRDAAVADLRVAEGPLDDLVGVLGPRAHGGLAPLLPAVGPPGGGEGPELGGAHRDAPVDPGEVRVRADLLAPGDAPVARVGVAELVVVPHEPVRLADVGHVGGREGRAVDVAAAGVLARVALHAEVPLVALLGLVHLGVARARRVLGRAGRLYDRGVDHRAAAHDQAGRLEAGDHDVEQGPPDVVLLQEVAEVLEGRGVGHAVPAPHEVADRERVVAGVLAGDVRQVQPALHEVHPEQRLGGPGLPAAPARRRPQRLDQGQQVGPGHHGVHPVEELGPPRAPGPALPLDLCEARLPARCHPRPSRRPSVPTVPL